MAATDIDKLVIYTRTDDSELLPLSSPTTQVAANSSGSSTGIALGFTFRLDGVSYTTISVFAYGFARLAGTENGATNADLFASNTNVLVAPWWDNLETVDTVGYVKTEQQGTAPFRRFVVEWYCNMASGQTSTDYDRIKFQLVLFETTDRLEMRYGTSTTAGTPAGTYSASRGIKGVTSVTTDNYRDLAVTNRELGGSKTTSTANLNKTHYDALAGATVCIEPNWPMCGRYVPILPQQLTGLQHPYGEPIWAIANNVNWLYCKHAPPLVNWAPHGTYSGAMRYVVPVTPSADGLDYVVMLITYSTAGGDLTFDVSADNASDPQPGAGGDWSTLDSWSALGTSSGWRDDGGHVVNIPAGTEYLRFSVTPVSGQVYIAHIMVYPEHQTDIEETVAPASGFLPMALGQIRQRGAAVHPETYNRAWANVARVLNDRRQMVFAYGRGNHADSGIGSTGGKRTRLIGIAPCGMSGWRGAEVDLAIYAYNVGSDGGTLDLIERGGAGVQFDIDTNGDEFRRQTSTLTLASDIPILAVSVTAVNEMRVGFAGATWVPGWSTDDLFAGVTPAPSLEKLISLVSRIARACTMSYAMTGLAVPLERVIGGGEAVRIRWMIQIATKAMRPMVVRINNDGSATAEDTLIVATSSGGAAEDIITLPTPHASGNEAYPWDIYGGDIQLASGAEVFDASPAASVDRMLESPTATAVDQPVTEAVTVAMGAGMCLVCYPVDPTTL